MQEFTECRTVGEIITRGAIELDRGKAYFGHGTDSAWDESVAIVFWSLGIDMSAGREVLDRTISEVDRANIARLFTRRIKERIPVPYLTREAWFCGESYYVDERVIIPRSPIAELIEAQFSPWLDHQKVKHILDLCCGSGCLGIAVAKAFPEARVDLVDISPDALDVARINIKRHGVGDRVSCIKSDLFNQVTCRDYDLVISNPPYVDAQDFETMPREFHREPVLALKGGNDGLDLVSRILVQVSEYLSSRGLLVVEVGNSETALLEKYPDLPLVWAEFERGGHGVFLLEAEDLLAYQSRLANTGPGQGSANTL